MTQNLKWKEDWAQAQQNLIKWWNGEGMALSMYCARRSEAIAAISQPSAARLDRGPMD